MLCALVLNQTEPAASTLLLANSCQICSIVGLVQTEFLGCFTLMLTLSSYNIFVPFFFSSHSYPAPFSRMFSPTCGPSQMQGKSDHAVKCGNVSDFESGVVDLY